MGTMVVVEQSCKTCGNKWRWASQPYIGGMAAGNLLLSASILFAGAVPGKTLKVLGLMGVAAISPATYFHHQSKYLHKTVRRVWEHSAGKLLAELKESDLVLGADGQNDSMGHYAKYGTYTLMALNLNKIICINTVQVQVHQSLSSFGNSVFVLQTYHAHNQDTSTGKKSTTSK